MNEISVVNCFSEANLAAGWQQKKSPFFSQFGTVHKTCYTIYTALLSKKKLILNSKFKNIQLKFFNKLSLKCTKKKNYSL